LLVTETNYRVTQKGSVHGLQFSTNAGLGVSYNFSKNIGIYLEPNAVYYIKDNRQLESFRTEKPLNLGLNIGLKYDF
jgi:predicted porin